MAGRQASLETITGVAGSATEADFDGVYDVNVKVPFFLVAELAPAMAARNKGSIINVTTMAAQFGRPGMALYGSSKAALVLPDDIAAAITYLATGDAAYVHGAILPVDGGRTAV